MADIQVKIVVDSLSEIITDELARLSSEYWSPKLGADQSDSEMKFRRHRIEKLRLMRVDFENLMYGLERSDV